MAHPVKLYLQKLNEHNTHSNKMNTLKVTEGFYIISSSYYIEKSRVLQNCGHH